MKELCLPTSTLYACLLLICNPYPSDNESNCNPLNWNPECTKGDCDDCGGEQWVEDLLSKIKEKDLQEKNVIFTHWVTEKEDKKTKLDFEKGEV